MNTAKDFRVQVPGPAQTAAHLPYGLLANEIRRLLMDDSVQVPPRLVQPLQGGASLFVMPALDARTASPS